MGLDMYLTGKRYLASWYGDQDDAKRTAIQELFPELADLHGMFGDESPVREVRIEAGYWRKANAIHDWFVKNCQDGKDECQPHPVYREDLEKLKALCERALKTREAAFESETAEDILPTADGFFFGNTEYDEWYYDSLVHTIRIVDRCLALPDAWSFEYCSSW